MNRIARALKTSYIQNRINPRALRIKVNNSMACYSSLDAKNLNSC